MAFRVVLVDDEPLARSRMTKLLAECAEDFMPITEATNGSEALRVIRETKPDVVFLDIQMPELDGFEVLAQLQNPPAIVFVTAFDDYALQAFERHAVDYLLKPVELERLRQTLDKLRNTLKLPAGQISPLHLEGLLGFLRRSYLKRLSVTIGDRTLLLPVQQVMYCSADHKYTRLHLADGRNYIVDFSLIELEQKLDPETFVRIHRSTIVNLEYVREIQKSLGRSVVVLQNPEKTRLDVGRTFAGRLHEL